MGQRWIIDVLADLKTFAQSNDLPLLARQLDDCARVAAGEIAETSGGAPIKVQGDEAGTRTILGKGGASQRTG
jgi:hypothetical protein